MRERSGCSSANDRGPGSELERLIPHWNGGAGLRASYGDDQTFLDAILDFIESDRALDREHLFVSGFASGGYFANETGCTRPEVRAIASHSGGSHVLRDCTSQRKPVILFHGVLDAVVPVACGLETRSRWAERNGCSAEVDVRQVLGGRCEYSKGCTPDGQVVLCLFDELGAAWAGENGQAGISSTDFASAAELSWAFFRQYAW